MHVWPLPSFMTVGPATLPLVHWVHIALLSFMVTANSLLLKVPFTCSSLRLTDGLSSFELPWPPYPWPHHLSLSHCSVLFSSQFLSLTEIILFDFFLLIICLIHYYFPSIKNNIWHIIGVHYLFVEYTSEWMNQRETLSISHTIAVLNVISLGWVLAYSFFT